MVTWTHPGERIIAIFKYGAFAWQGYRNGQPGCEIKKLVFTESSVLTMKNVPPPPGLENSAMTQIGLFNATFPQWEALKRMEPTVERSTATITKEMLTFGNSSIAYKEIKKIKIFTPKGMQDIIPGSMDIAFVGGFLSGDGFDFYVPITFVDR